MMSLRGCCISEHLQHRSLFGDLPAFERTLADTFIFTRFMLSKHYSLPCEPLPPLPFTCNDETSRTYGCIWVVEECTSLTITLSYQTGVLPGKYTFGRIGRGVRSLSCAEVIK